MNRILSLAAGALLLAATALAGPIDGKWVSERKMERDGQSMGKIDGNTFSFTTMISTPNGDMKTSYSGTVEGSVLKGNAEREGGQARPFEAKKQ